jgi:hypothetical protein
MNATETSAAPPPVNKYATGSENPLRINADERPNNNSRAGTGSLRLPGSLQQPASVICFFRQLSAG